MRYDTAIIGTGPAGLSAALTLQARGAHFTWIGNPALSDKIAKAERISNYPGFADVTGRALQASFRAQIDAAGISVTDRTVSSVTPVQDHYLVMAGSDCIETQTVILAVGVTGVGALPGEAAFVGRGVSYCATCDGNLYRNRTVAVLSDSPRFAHEVLYLAGLAAHVYFFPADSRAAVAVAADNLETVPDKPAEILGDRRVREVRLRSGAVLPVDGVFCLRESVALSALLPGLACEDGHIAVNRAMETNLRGVYAAGDCTGRPYQYAKAIGEGNIAAHSVLAYLAGAHGGAAGRTGKSS